MGNMPSDMQGEKYAYFNGKILTLNKISIDPYDLGFIRGYGVFDVMRTQNGKPLLIDKHWHRFQNAAKTLNLKIPLNKNKYQEIVKKLLKLNNFPETLIRTILTGGISKDAFSLSGRETFLILTERFKPLDKEIYEKGVDAVTLNFCRELPKIKTTNYLEAIRCQNYKNRRKAFEIIYIKNNEVLEASTSNIFIFKKNILITPRDKILFGVTRNLVIKLAKNLFQIKERKISGKELFNASEIFLTATNKNIVPVVKINGKKINNGKVGKNTKILMVKLLEFLEKY